MRSTYRNGSTPEIGDRVFAPRHDAVRHTVRAIRELPHVTKISTRRDDGTYLYDREASDYDLADRPGADLLGPVAMPFIYNEGEE